MDLDYSRLADMVVAARGAKAWTQKDLAAASGLGITTVQRIEDANADSRPSARTLKALDRTFGWEEGSCAAILHGGEPTPLSVSEHTRTGNVTGATDGVRGLPPAIRAALSQGETLAGDIIDLTRPGAAFRLIVVAQRGLYTTEEDIEGLRLEMEEWIRIQQGIRDLAQAPENSRAQEGDS